MKFTVTVTGCTPEQAAQVMTERLGHDEELGFGYEVTWSAQGPPSDDLRELAQSWDTWADGLTSSEAAAAARECAADVWALLRRKGEG
jgi:hypothetical protein